MSTPKQEVATRWRRLSSSRAEPPEMRLRAWVIEVDSARRDAVRVACSVAALGFEYVTVEQDDLRHTLDVVRWWTVQEADEEGLRAARARVALVAARTDADGDRCAWLALQMVVALLDVALEDMVDLAGKRARDLVCYALDAMCWPDADDEAVRAVALERLRDTLDSAMHISSRGGVSSRDGDVSRRGEAV